MGKKVKNIWWVVIFLLILTACLLPLILLSNKYSFTLSIGWQAILIFIVSLICQLLSRHPLHELTGKINLRWLKELIIGSGLGAALMLLPALLLLAIGAVHWQPNVFTLTTVVSGFVVFGQVAIAEELLFRGFMFQRLIKAFGIWPAQLIIGGLFLLTHLDNPGMVGTVKLFAAINIFTASVLFGITYLKTNSLAMPLGVHFMANFTQGTILGFGVSGGKEPSLLTPISINQPVWLTGGDFGLEASLPGLFFLVMLVGTLYFWRNAIKFTP